MTELATPLGAEKLVELRRFAAEPLFDPWEEHPVPDFPFGVLPNIVADFVRSQSELIGCDPNGLAVACLAALGGALDHQFGLKMMRNGAWWASPRLWVLLSGDPSRKKTPAINAALHELEVIQGEVYEAWETTVAARRAANLPETDDPPRPPRYVTGDTTTEKLGEILGRQRRGILVKRDELSGWIGSMEKYSGRGSGAADRAFWLQAFDGGRYTIDRIGRGETHVHNLSVSLVGGIQPARLAELHDLTSDGLLQRFIPVVLKEARFPIDAAAGDGEAAYRQLIRRLILVEPARLIMTDAAVADMERLRQHIFDVEQASGGLAAGFQAYAGKLQGVAGSVALILHMATNPVHGATSHVDVDVVAAVERIVREFLLPHAYEFYRTAETFTDGDRIRKIASWILTCGKDRIVLSDLTANVACFRNLGITEGNKLLSPLVACDWLLPEGNDPMAKAWKVQPAVRAQMADRARIEGQRKASLAELMNARRKNGARR